MEGVEICQALQCLYLAHRTGVFQMQALARTRLQNFRRAWDPNDLFSDLPASRDGRHGLARHDLDLHLGIYPWEGLDLKHNFRYLLGRLQTFCLFKFISFEF